MEKITFEEYSKVEIRVGKITEAQRVPKSNKMIRLAVSFGVDNTKQILTNIGKEYEPEDLINVITTFVTNLQTVTIMGFESDGMLFAGTKSDGNTLLIKLNDVELGSKIG
jgi:methionyl-tRNA synthetase